MSTPERDAIRAAFFNLKPVHKLIEFNGMEMELRQPPMEAVMLAAEKEDRKATLTYMLINYCYVPGTEEKVFEAADADAIGQVPFGKDWINLSTAIADLTSVDMSIKRAEGN